MKIIVSALFCTFAVIHAATGEFNENFTLTFLLKFDKNDFKS